MATLVSFHAHPDDESIITGGVMALAAERGHRVVLVVATRGEVGEVADGFLDPGESLADRRVIETERAAEVLGVDRVEFLGYRDSGMAGEPTNDHPECFWQADVTEAAGRLAEILTVEGTEVFTCYDSHGIYGHPDHIQVQRVGRRAAEMAGVARVYEATMNRTRIREGTLEWAERDDIGDLPDPAELETIGTPDEEITTEVDVSAVLDRKRAALACHRSQVDEDSFFLSMPDADFAMAFGIEWFIRVDAGAPTQGGPLGRERGLFG